MGELFIAGQGEIVIHPTDVILSPPQRQALDVISHFELRGMKFIQRFVAISMIILPWLLSAQTPDQNAVKQSFGEYKSAILNDNGEEAV